MNQKYAIFETTQNCNLSCRYCYNHWKADTCANHLQSGEKPEFRRSRKIIARLAKAGIRHLTFTGGEPLLEQRLPELVLYARLKRMSVSIITNGTAGNRETFQHLIRLGVTHFSLPCHSDSPEIHDRMTGSPGSWEKTRNTRNLITDLGGEVIPVIIITALNCHRITETLTFLAEQGLKRVMLNRFNLGGNGFQNRDLLETTKEQLNSAFKDADQTAQRLNLQLTSNVCIPFCMVNPSDYRRIAFVACAVKRETMPLTLDFRGNVRVCNHSPQVVGNVLTKKLNEILDHPYLDEWHDNIPEFCNACKDFAECLGGCRAAAEQAGHGLRQVDPVLIRKDV